MYARTVEPVLGCIPLANLLFPGECDRDTPLLVVEQPVRERLVPDVVELIACHRPVALEGVHHVPGLAIESLFEADLTRAEGRQVERDEGALFVGRFVAHLDGP